MTCEVNYKTSTILKQLSNSQAIIEEYEVDYKIENQSEIQWIALNPNEVYLVLTTKFQNAVKFKDWYLKSKSYLIAEYISP